ncbi:biogenesis of lysosome-related organelles complex 1 subunit 2-like [Clavelina lepadiformis]|uniref:biogenesis of lysosome-related organelles complex 1 subunit 2-like n=1 Tax=Clavelina lepadiformis TaxID=159417 RepID=UPI004041CE25
MDDSSNERQAEEVVKAYSKGEDVDMTKKVGTCDENADSISKETNSESDIFEEASSNSISELKEPNAAEANSTLNSLCEDMFTKLALYLNGEADATIEDYELLKQMNVATASKYEVMLKIAKNVGDNLHEVNQKFSDLQPYLDQIDQIEESVLALEQAAYKLDIYSKKLEERLKQADRL